MSIIGRIKSAFLRTRAEGHEAVVTPEGVDAQFVLVYGDLVIGTLRLHQQTWEFAYSRQFIDQSDVKPLIDFPDVTKVYRADDLWPFFMARIPSMAQPKVQDVISKEGIDQTSDVELLRRFGRETITDPFVLEPA
jgi:HipA-like protein